MDHFRFASHAFTVPLSLILSWLILRNQISTPNLWHWITLLVFNYAVSRYFVDFLADAAEGIQTSFLAERELENGNFGYMQKLLPSYRTPLEHIERRLHGEGDGFC